MTLCRVIQDGRPASPRRSIIPVSIKQQSIEGVLLLQHPAAEGEKAGHSAAADHCADR
jgi:hypothetical protein